MEKQELTPVDYADEFYENAMPDVGDYLLENGYEATRLLLDEEIRRIREDGESFTDLGSLHNLEVARERIDGADDGR